MFDFIIAERKSKCKLIIRHYLNIVAAMARTVELAEVHALPDAEEGLAVLDEHGLIPAVVCGQYTTARPLCTPLSRMTSRSLAVILYMPS